MNSQGNDRSNSEVMKSCGYKQDTTDIMECEEENCAGPAKAIQPLDKDDVHRICSGQVVLSLATAVKELVENSIDAQSTCVEVRLREYGSECIEVVDNGHGVEEANFRGLTLKHHTSKLSDFSDLVNVETFGFRGEALSSLCALSNISIVTRHKDANVGTRLVYNNNGHLLQQSVQPRQVGTTVCVEKLFSTLPVRHKEFTRTLKKEFSKMVEVLNAYCLIATGVKISCTNQIGKGKKTLIVSTGGNAELKDNIINVYGAKQFQTLVPFRLSEADEESCYHYGINLSQEENKQIFQITGFMSSCEHKLGRSSTDRQFFFINKRPCDPVKISRLVNEVYHQYNRHQYPFVILNISLLKDSVDVNVTPDKRQIFMQHEKLLLATLKTSLVKMWQTAASVYNLNQSVLSFHQKSAEETEGETQRSKDITHQQPLNLSRISDESSRKTALDSKPELSALTNLKRSFSSAFAKGNSSQSPQTTPSNNKQRKLDGFISKKTLSPIGSLQCSSYARSTLSQSEAKCSENTASHAVTILSFSEPQNNSTLSVSDKYGSSETAILDSCLSERVSQQTAPSENATSADDEDDVICSELTDEESLCEEDPVMTEQDGKLNVTNFDTQIIKTKLDTVNDCSQRKRKNVVFNMTHLAKVYSQKQKKLECGDSLTFRSFRAKINPTENNSAEEELKREIKKENFKDMKILGQFNLGFIITRLNEDLFIVDQHATDEKYNFEMLQRHTQLHCQKLIQPQLLHLTVANQATLLDNLEIFQQNGFEFLIKDDGDPSQRVQLTARPVSKTWEFGREDIEELIFMLSDSPGVLCRPSRIRQMFASRACRKSIMIGTALNKSQMKKVIRHMGEIDQPWNCPHGRPTMRHLINLDMVKKKSDSCQ